MLRLRQIDLLLHIMVIDCPYSCICMCKQKNFTQYFCQFFKNISQALIFLFLCCQFRRGSTAVIFSWIQFATRTTTNTQTFVRYSSTARVWHIKVFARWIIMWKKSKTEKCAKIPLLFKVIVSSWFKLFGTLPAKFGVIFNSERGKYCTWWSACSFMIDFFLFDRMNVSPRPLPCAEWMVRLTPVHVQQTQPEFLLITAVAAGQSESEMVSIYIPHYCAGFAKKKFSTVSI